MENESKCYSCKTVECVKEQYCPYGDFDKQNETSLQNKISCFNSESIKAINGRPTEKLLHERLRDTSWKYPEKRTICNSRYSITLTGQEAAALADEIERYYIPRPRFEDGEPVQFIEDYVEGCQGYVEAMLIFKDGSGTIYGENDDPFPKEDCGADIGIGLKRSYHKVYDADGAEIKIGDNGWSTLSGNKLSPVKGFRNDKFGTIVQLDDGYEIEPSCFTHKEPDSIQKVIDYLIDCGNADPHGLYYVAADRLSALIERGA